MFRALRENVVLGFAFCDEIAIHTNVTAAYYF